MKKVGIITLFGEYNFGNRLQNYAVQEVLKKLNLDVKTIKYLGLHDDVARSETEKDISRLNKFKEFNKNIVFADEAIYKELEVREDFHEDFDYFVIGSDQIWNFTFNKIFSDKAFAAFAPKHKKVSFSASFGLTHLPEEGTENYHICKNGIEDMKAISIREDAGQKLIEDLTQRNDATVLLDPTMFLKTEEWEKVMKKPESLKTDKFIVKCFLGDESDKPMQELKRIAEENDCEIIDISDVNSPYYDMGPAEFLYLEKNAFLVATDSFHVCVFSILFSTPFIVLERNDSVLESMHSRIETLLRKFKMEYRMFKDVITEELLNCDYSHTIPILEKERIRTREFLEAALQ